MCKLLLNINSNNPTLLAKITSVKNSTTLINDFKQTVDTLQSAIIATKMTTSQKQRIYALTGVQGGRVLHGGGGGNHCQGKLPYKGVRERRGVRGGRGSSNKCVRFNNQ